MSKTKVELIKGRLARKTEQARQMLENKWKDQRLIAAGAFDDLGADGLYGYLNDDRESIPVNADQSTEKRELYDMSSVRSGRVNMILREFKSIVQQTAIQSPTFEFEGLKNDDLLFHRLYFEQAWQYAPFGCDAISQFDHCKWDMLIHGIAFPGVSMRNGRPIVYRYDPMQVLYDTSSTNLDEMRWCAIWESRRASEWAEMFGWGPFEEWRDTDPNVEVVFYYDIDGNGGGTTAAFLGASGEPGKLLDHAETWCYIDIPTGPSTQMRVSYLPVYPLTYLRPTGYANPLGLVDMLAPLQMFLTEAYMRIQRQSAVGHMRFLNINNLEDETKKALAAGRIPDFLQTKADTDMAEIGTIVPAPGVDENLFVLIEKIERFFTETSDDNPYSGGQPQNVEFATESHAIQAASGKGMTYIVKRIARAMEIVAQRFLWLACEFDDTERVLNFEELTLVFGPDNPVREYLSPHARVIVREDDLRYISRDEKLQRAMLFGAEMQKYAAILGPNVLLKAAEEFLKAYGVDDIPSFLGQSQTSEAAAGQPGMNPLGMEQGMAPEQASGF